MSDINVQSFSGKVKVSNDLTVTTNVHADYFKGDGSLLTNLPSGSGGVWNTNSDNEIYFISSNVGISNADPGHNLSVGSNLYVDDDGSNVLVVTGNVKADHFVGDGSLLTGLSGSGGVWSTNAANEIYFINNNVGISNADPGHNLSVGSNLYVDDDGLDVLVVTGNVNATYLKGNGSLITNLPSGSGGVWSTNADNEIYFISSNVGISNSNPGHNLSVGSNLYVDDDGSNVLVVDGNIAAESIVIGGISIVPSYPLSLVTETGNITPHTIQFTNATTGLVVSSNIVVTGNVTAAYLHGDASNVTGITSNLHQIAENGNVTSNTLQFTNATTGFVTTANVEVGGELTVSSNLTVAGNATVSSNLTVTGNVLVSDDLTVTGNVAVDTDTLFVDTVNNRVGVGTDSPLNILHLSSADTSLDASGSATFDQYSLIIHNTRGSGSNDSELGLCFNHYDTSYPSSTRTPGAAITHERTTSWSKGKLHFKTKSENTEAGSCDTRMTIDESGYVGIGTTGPSHKLHLHNDDEYVYYRMSTTAGGVTDNFDIAQWNSTRSSGDHGIFLNNRANTTMAFNTNDTERMRIHNGTTVTVAGGTAGKGVAFAHAGIAIDRVWGNYPSITVMNENSGSETNQGQLRIHGCNVSYNSYPNSSGSDFACSVYIDGTYQSSSDRRFKTNITTIDNALEKVLSITGKRYQLLNSDGNIRTNVSTNDYKYGFIAQEIQDAGFEETYIHYTDEDDGTDGYNKAYSLDYDCFIPLLVNAVKEQQQIIETMRTEIENIKNSA